MVLKTKSIQEPMNIREDGVRICIMRRYNPEKHENYGPINDHWIDLAPSEGLLEDWNKKKISWHDYVTRFSEEIYSNPEAIKKIKNLIDLAMEQDVTLLCFEKTPENCHRRIVVLECQKYEPKLEVILN